VLYNEKTAWQPEGIAFLNISLGGRNGTQIAGRFYDIKMGEWYTATFLVDFKTEMVTFGLNERSITQSLREDVVGDTFDPEPFYQSLATHAIRVGAPKPYDPGQPVEWQRDGDTVLSTGLQSRMLTPAEGRKQ
jgi:hypothetical protein